jgi:hypothetical protein
MTMTPKRLGSLLQVRELKAVYKGDRELQKLKELCCAYKNLVEDATRAQNRLKAIYRGRGPDSSGTEIYRPERRADYLAELSDEAARFRAESLLDQIESLRELRKQAKSRFLEQARMRPDYQILASVPGFGAARVGELLPDCHHARSLAYQAAVAGLISGWRWSPNQALTTKRSREESSN